MKEQVGNPVGYRTRDDAFKAAEQLKIAKEDLIMSYDSGSYYLMTDRNILKTVPSV